MSVSLLEVIEAGGYNLATLEDARWLLSKQSEFDELIEQAEELIEQAEDAENEAAETEYQLKFPKEEEDDGQHSRFDEEHRLICEDCTAAYFDFCQEQADDARLDAMINAEAGETEGQ